MASAGRPPRTSAMNNLAQWLPPEWADWSLPDPKTVDEQLKKEFTDEQRAQAWDKAAKTVKTYHDELVEQWQKAMDSVLVYAGLFSAVLTAFNVQSYQLLQPGPSDPMLATLQQISAQLNSFSVNPSFINSTQPARSLDQLQPPFRASPSTVWINTLWFSSLVCSLASASIALIAKQWLYEESKGLSGTSREAARLRQYRLDSLIKWRVGAIVIVPSVLLQAALFLFLAGLLVLLWTIHETVAAVVTALAGVLFVFVFVTTITPMFAPDCCYRSPLAYGVFMAIRLALNGVGRLVQGLSRRCAAIFHSLLRAIPTRLAQLRSIVFTVYFHCDRWTVGHIPTWKGAEQNEVARDSGLLDRHIATMAYTTTSGVEHLEALHILLSDLPCDQALACFPDVHRSWIHLWGPNGAARRSKKLAHILLGKPFHNALRQLLSMDRDERDRAIGSVWTEESSASHSFLSDHYYVRGGFPGSPQFLSTLALISIGNSVLARKTFRILYDNLFYNLEADSMPSMVPYDVLRDTMALARWNVEHRVTPDEDELRYKFQAVRVSLGCTRWVLTNNLSLTGEQEAWIRQETRSIFHLLTEKSGAFIALCRGVTRGYEMMPDGLLSGTAERPGLRFRHLLDAHSTDFKSIIREQKHKERHEKRCFQAQQPPVTVF